MGKTMRILISFLLSVFFLFSAVPAFSSGPSVREEAIAISKELRDPAANNQSLFDSNSPQAFELKAKIYQLLESGNSREEILEYFSSRFGRQIRYAPPVEAATAVLWVIPAALILFLLGVACFLFYRHKKVSK